MIVNKSDIINQINQKIESLTTSDIDYSVKKVISYISRSLYTGKRIEIRGFGTFSLHHYNSRTARNPKTGEHVALEKRSNVHFKPSKELRTRVDNKN